MLRHTVAPVLQTLAGKAGAYRNQRRMVLRGHRLLNHQLPAQEGQPEGRLQKHLVNGLEVQKENWQPVLQIRLVPVLGLLLQVP